MAYNTVVIVSSHSDVRTSLESLFVQAGFEAETASSLAVWLQMSRQEPVCCVVLEMDPGDLAAPESISRFAALCSLQAVLVLTDPGDVPTAVQAIRQGAADVMQKPIEHIALLERVRRFDAMNH